MSSRQKEQQVPPIYVISLIEVLFRCKLCVCLNYDKQKDARRILDDDVQ